MRQHLSEADFALVKKAVEAAETNTAGEIVTVVADRSDGYTDVALVWAVGVAFTAIAVLAFWPSFFLDRIDWVLGTWNNPWTPREIFGLALFVGIAKFAAAWLVQLWQPLKFFLIPGPIKSHRTYHRALAIFSVSAKGRTTGKTGILIYLSMRERRAEIVADEAITSKVEPEAWGKAMAAMLAELKRGQVGAGMAAAVERVGVILAEHLPKPEGDVNQLPDRLIEL